MRIKVTAVRCILSAIFSTIMFAYMATLPENFLRFLMMGFAIILAIVALMNGILWLVETIEEFPL